MLALIAFFPVVYASDLSSPTVGTLTCVPGGTFTMGSPDSEKGRNSVLETQHSVTVSPFCIMTTEVTQQMWRGVMGDNPVDTDDCREDHGVSLLGEDKPVVCVTPHAAHAFANALSKKEGLTELYGLDADATHWLVGNGIAPPLGYRIPTEAEWEYAARAGSATVYTGTSKSKEVCAYVRLPHRDPA